MPYIKFFSLLVLMISIEAIAASRVPGGNGLEASADCLECMAERMGSLQSQARDLLKEVKVIGGEDRVKQTRLGQRNGYAAIGRVFTNRTFTDKGVTFRKMGTAFMVSPCIAMTNFHVNFGGESLNEIIPNARRLDQQFINNRDEAGNVKISLPNDINYSVTLQLGENADGTFKRQAIGRPVVFGNRDTQGGSGGDWIAIKFEEPNCPGSDPEIGFLPLAGLPLNDKERSTLHTAGFAGKENPTISSLGSLSRSSRKCDIKQMVADEPAFTHDCSTEAGQSGSPILVMQDGQLKVVGMVKGFDLALDRYVNVGVSSQAFMPEVQPVVDRDLESHRKGPVSTVHQNL